MTKLTPEQDLMIKQAAERIHRHFQERFSPETIARYIKDSRQNLEGRAKINTWLPVLIERFTRDRLRALARLEGIVDKATPGVVFLCVHNAGRSQMAAAFARRLGGDRVDVFSGGSDPSSEVNPAAVEAMREIGIDMSSELPQPWTDEIIQAADVIVTMGCGDACPVFPGITYRDWEIDDPAGLGVDAVRVIRDEIERRVRNLLVELDVAVASSQ